MNTSSGKPAAALDPHAIDLFEFARSGRQASGAVRLSQLPRMLNEVPADAPDRDTVFTWQAEGFTQKNCRTTAPTGSSRICDLRCTAMRGSRASAA